MVEVVLLGMQKSFQFIFPYIFLFFINITAVFAQSIQNPLGDATISSVITRIVQFIFTFGLAVAVIVLAIGAFQYLFSFGSEQKVSQAHKTMWYAVIGIIIMLAGQGITSLIKSILGVS